MPTDNTTPAPAGEDVPTEPGIWFRRHQNGVGGQVFIIRELNAKLIACELRKDGWLGETWSLAHMKGGWSRAVPASELAALKADNERLKAEIQKKNQAAGAWEMLVTSIEALQGTPGSEGTRDECLNAYIDKYSGMKTELAALRQQVAELTREVELWERLSNLTEHHADDDELVDEKFANSLGLKQKSDSGYCWVLGVGGVGRTIVLSNPRGVIGDDVWYLSLGGVNLNIVVTRRDVRRLAAALGVTLKEPAEGGVR